MFNKLLLMRVYIFIIILFLTVSTDAQQLLAGTSSVNIVPKLPVALQGQMYLRIGDSVESPLLATALAITSKDTAIFVSCDLTFITSELSRNVRKEIQKLLPEINPSKIIINATHTHTVPVYGTGESSYAIPDRLTRPKEYFNFLIDKISGVIKQAWENRQPVTVSWGLGHAVVANNRRGVYTDGRSVMYGNTNLPIFKNIEGMEDNDLNALFFQNKKGKLIAVCADVPCPAQEAEGHTAVNADYWHDTRLALKKRWGNDLAVISWIGAAGDMSPHFMYRGAAEKRMATLAGRTRMQEIAHRIDMALAETYHLVKKEQHNDVIFEHKIDSITLPGRTVNEKEYINAKKIADSLKIRIEKNPAEKGKFQSEMNWYQDVVNRYDNQEGKPDPVIQTEIHAIRLGDIAIASNEFELFTDYGVRMQARSRALQTFVMQLAVGYYLYLPTEIAVKGGGYSAIIQSCLTTPEGGTILTDKTVELINSMFPKK
jgi:hypothetical protein